VTRPGRRVLTTVPADFRSLRDHDFSAPGVDAVDRGAFSQAGLLRRLLHDAGAYDAILLNGSGHLDQFAAALLALQRSSGAIVISDCTWQRGTWWLDRLICCLGLRAMDSPRTTYCVLSSDEVTLFPQTWGVDPSHVVFTPFCFTLTADELAAPTSSTGTVFSGGDSLRDYGPLLSAAATLKFELMLAVQRPPQPQRALPENVRATSVPHGGFIELMRHASVVVVPLRPGIERSAGQQTYLNAMALGKLVITTDSPGARDYIEHGLTGLIVAPGDTDSIANALTWALDPSRAREVAEIGARAQQVVLSRFRPADYFRRLVAAVDEMLK
jgi:Glycosyl transferases group 1